MLRYRLEPSRQRQPVNCEVYMTRRLLCATALLIASMSAAALGAETFGTAPTVSEATPITQLLAKPADFEGKTVRVEGVVTGVCTMMGCWMALAPADAPKGTAILIKVDDGVIVFPTSARGKRATAQGLVERIGTSPEAQEAAHEHAEQEGHGKNTEAARWQIKATGAIVY
jgi:hypothetical protein